MKLTRQLVMDKMKDVKKSSLQKIWHTKSCQCFTKNKFKNRLGYEHITSDESYIIIQGKTGKQVQLEGFTAKKTHPGDDTPTTYFIPSEIITTLPIIVTKTIKKHSLGKVYHLITASSSIRIKGELLFKPRELPLVFGNPSHTNPIHHTIHRYKRLIQFIEDGFNWRCVTVSGFGKSVLFEALAHLTNEAIDVTSPSPAKLFWCIAKFKRVNVNEMPMASSKEQETKLKNIMMCISQNSGIITNPSRSMPGVPEQVDISEHSVTFTHNVAQYYHAKNNKCFEEYFEYNIINRLYCQELRGNMELDEHNIKFEEVAEEYAWFYLAFIKTLRFLKEHRKDKEFDNKYPDIDVQATFKFSKKEDRYLAHFIKFAKWCSHFAKDKEQYVKILTEDYNNHNEYKNEIQQYEN